MLCPLQFLSFSHLLLHFHLSLPFPPISQLPWPRLFYELMDCGFAAGLGESCESRGAEAPRRASRQVHKGQLVPKDSANAPLAWAANLSAACWLSSCRAQHVVQPVEQWAHKAEWVLLRDFPINIDRAFTGPGCLPVKGLFGARRAS